MLLTSKRRPYEYQIYTVFLLLFPGFFGYHTLIGLSLMPPVLGGYFGIVSLVTLPFVILSFFALQGKYKGNYRACDLVFLVIIVWIILVATVNYFLSKPENFSNEMLFWSLSGVLFNLSCYFIAKTIPLDSKKFRVLLQSIIWGMVFVIVINIGEAGIFYLMHESDYQESVATYQGFARSLVVVGILSAVMQKSFKRALIFFSVTAVSLYFNGGRTEFVLFIASFAALSIYLSASSVKKFLLMLLILVLMVLFIVLYGEQLISFLPSNRMSQLLSINSASSFQTRYILTWNAIETISNNPLFGSYGGYVDTGGIGSYSHNILSAWVNLGLIGIMLYLLIFAIIIVGIIKGFLLGKNGTVEAKVAFVFAFFAISAFVTSKDYSYMLFGLMVGFNSRYMSSLRHTNSTRPMNVILRKVRK